MSEIVNIVIVGDAKWIDILNAARSQSHLIVFSNEIADGVNYTVKIEDTDQIAEGSVHSWVNPDHLLIRTNKGQAGVIINDVLDYLSRVSTHPDDIVIREDELKDANDDGVHLHVSEAVPVLGDSDEFLNKLDKGKKSMFMRYVRRKLVILMYWLLAIVTLLMVGMSFLPEPTHYKLSGRSVTDNRGCTLMFDDGTTVEGTRSYSYRYHELFGIRWYDRSVVEEKTTLRIKSTGILVAGHGDATRDAWIREVQIGEVTNLVLENYPEYTFVLNGKMMVLDYKHFCR